LYLPLSLSLFLSICRYISIYLYLSYVLNSELHLYGSMCVVYISVSASASILISDMCGAVLLKFKRN
jgi:hypothetical protein